jgi:hypothetical protein
VVRADRETADESVCGIARDSPAHLFATNNFRKSRFVPLFPIVSSPRDRTIALGGDHRRNERADSLEKPRFVKERAGNPLISHETAKGKLAFP